MLKAMPVTTGERTLFTAISTALRLLHVALGTSMLKAVPVATGDGRRFTAISTALRLLHVALGTSMLKAVPVATGDGPRFAAISGAFRFQLETLSTSVFIAMSMPTRDTHLLAAVSTASGAAPVLSTQAPRSCFPAAAIYLARSITTVNVAQTVGLRPLLTAWKAAAVLDSCLLNA